MLASEIITRARIVLQDNVARASDTTDRWPDSELLLWLSDAQRETVKLVPEAYAITGLIDIPANTLRVSLPAGKYRLLDVTRNMGATGTTPGPIIRLVGRDVLDAINSLWHVETADAIEHYLYDYKQPRSFMVHPMAASACKVEAVCSCAPPEITAVGTTISLDDTYANSLLEYVLYRAYSKDADYAVNMQLATGHYEQFVNGLTGNIQATQQRSPADKSGGSKA